MDRIPSPSVSMASASRPAVTTSLAPPKSWTSAGCAAATAPLAGKYPARSTDPSKALVYFGAVLCKPEFDFLK